MPRGLAGLALAAAANYTGCIEWRSLTHRSSGARTAGHRARKAAMRVIRAAGPAPCRCRYLSSNICFTSAMSQPPSPSVHALSRSDWRQWLADNHASATGVWLVSYKKGTGMPRVEYGEAVEEALCFGWVDSKPNKLDAERTLLWFAPRKAGSGWSRPNKDRVHRMIEGGLMAAAGLLKVEQAKLDGSWTKLDAVEDLVLPLDLAAALAAAPDAARNFEAFPRSAKRGILEWIVNAKTASTRAKRIEETARLASTNERANQWRPKT
jgi:uncharacterized protein YdeI (YjbR/CyaY-like superfamily)